MQTPSRQKLPNFIIPYFHLFKCRHLHSAARGACSPSPPFPPPLFSLYDHLISTIGRHISKLPVFVYSISPLPLIPSIVLSIILYHLSLWFGIHGTALNRFIFYLSDCLFCIKCSHDLSAPHKSCYGVLQGSVLGPLLFTLYTIPLISLIFSLSLDHHLYANDTQLFVHQFY